MISWLEPESEPHFPKTSSALEDPAGLLAAGGKLSIDWLLLAYRQGIFPWFNHGEPILWWSPAPRTVLYPQKFHLSKSLGKLARQGRYFYWGYSADPQRLTAGAQATLLNVMHYMHGKRNSLTVPFVCKTRKVLWVYTRLGRDSGYKRGVEEHFPNSLLPEWRKSRYSYTP